MRAQDSSNELRVINANIEKDLEKFGDVGVGVTVFLPTAEKTRGESTGATGTADGSAVAGTKIEFGDGNITNATILVPIGNAMSVQAGKLNPEKKKAIQEKAEKSKAEKSKEAQEKEKGEIGE